MNYSEIKNIALIYADSQDPELVNAIPALMSILESRLNKRLAVQKQIVNIEIPYQVNVQEYALPADFLSMSDLETVSLYVAPPVIVPDTEPPTRPGMPIISVVNPTTLFISWDVSIDNIAVAGYRIYRDGVLLNDPLITSNSYTDINLTPETRYIYTITALDAAGNVSETSLPGEATTPLEPDITPPTIPANVIATPSSPISITITWDASTDENGVAGYNVYRNTVRINPGNITALSYLDTGLIPETAYSYTVTAFDSSGNVSEQSIESIGTTPSAADTTPPSAPSNLAGTVMSFKQIDYTWTASTDNIAVTAYEAWRDGAYVGDIAAPATNFSSTSLAPATTSSVYIKAKDAANNISAASNTVTLTTMAALPDFVCTGISATAANVWTVTLVNQGETAITDTLTIDFYLDNVYAGWSTVASREWVLNVPYIFVVTPNDGTGAIAPGTHNLKIVVDPTDEIPEINIANNTTIVSYVVPGLIDNTPPSVPTGLAAAGVSTTQINVSWSASTDNVGVAGYRLYDGATQIGGNLGASTLSYNHTGLVQGSSHTYQVLAFDAAGNASAKSTGVTATTTSTVNAIYISTTGNDTTGNGSIGSPYRTWLKASQVSSPGKTIYARGGTYTERFYVQVSGTAGNEITYASYPGEVAIISGAGLPYMQWDGAIQINTKNYITIRDLTINDSQNYAIRCQYNSDHITVDNVRVNRANNSAFSALTGTNMVVKNCNFRQISKTQGRTAPPGSQGIQEGISFNNVQGFQCFNNIIYDCENEGIDAKANSRNGTIYNNDVSGILQRMGIYIDGYGSGCSDITIYNNKVHDVIDTDTRYPGLLSSGNGISIGAERGAAVYNISIYNNLIYNYCDSGICLSHWVDAGQTPPVFTNISIINNTIYNTNHLNQNTWSHAGIFVDGTNAQNPQLNIKNNIMSNIQTVNGLNNMYIAAGIVPQSNTNNLFFGGTTGGTNFITGDPRFVMPGSNFALQNNSPAINAGTASGAPATDITGAARIGTPDIGAYENLTPPGVILLPV